VPVYFLGFAAAFTVIVVGMVWYSRFMFQKIYGDMREQIECVVSGSAPPAWDKRLVRRIAGCGSVKAREAVEAEHRKYVDRRVMDCIVFMKRTSLVESEAERESIVERLEAFRREYGQAGV
jgi:hypothetical protein